MKKATKKELKSILEKTAHLIDLDSMNIVLLNQLHSFRDIIRRHDAEDGSYYYYAVIDMIGKNVVITIYSNNGKENFISAHYTVTAIHHDKYINDHKLYINIKNNDALIIIENEDCSKLDKFDIYC